jgi:two-component system, chemotaxis family, chemotaxis protein CheY
MHKILVVDDSHTVRLYYRHVASELSGVEVEEAQNGVEGLEKALKGEFSLFVVDVNMPKMDGYSFLRAVRRTPALRATPAIMVTTEDKPDDRLRAYAAGANLHLTKPFDPAHLRRLFALALGRLG